MKLSGVLNIDGKTYKTLIDELVALVTTSQPPMMYTMGVRPEDTPMAITIPRRKFCRLSTRLRMSPTKSRLQAIKLKAGV